MTKEIKHQICGDGFIQYRPAKTPPPWDTWVGLTDEEIGYIAVKSKEGISPHDDTLRFAQAIEQALKEKNT
jgi:hypothetical protein